MPENKKIKSNGKLFVFVIKKYNNLFYLYPDQGSCWEKINGGGGSLKLKKPPQNKQNNPILTRP